MKPRLIVTCPIIFLIIWLPIGAASLPEETPEVPFASDRTPDQLVLLCGFPGEFDPVQFVATPNVPKPPATFSPPITMPAVETTARTPVPELSTLVLLGVGLIGVMTCIRRTRT